MEQVAERITSDDIAIVSSKLLKLFLESLTFTVSFIQEDDGSFTGSVEELDLFANAPSKDECLTLLLDDMKEYAQDFYNDFQFWSSAPNRKKHIPYVLKILSESDEKLLEAMKHKNPPADHQRAIKTSYAIIA